MSEFLCGRPVHKATTDEEEQKVVHYLYTTTVVGILCVLVYFFFFSRGSFYLPRYSWVNKFIMKRAVDLHE